MIHFWRDYLPKTTLGLTTLGLIFACGAQDPIPGAEPTTASEVVAPIVVSEEVSEDSDDPAIWIDPSDPSRSLVIGTDKAGRLYAFDLEGRILADRTVTSHQRLNNVDVEYGIELGGEIVDVAVATDRDAGLLHAFRLPELTPIDGGGFEAFAGDPPELRRPMGVALYKRPSDGALFAIVSRKAGPSGAYLWQYRLEDGGDGALAATRVRAFGDFSGEGEIEAVAVDDELGYVYYSDELAGIHKYMADPDAPAANQELALFGTEGFAEDREGISIYRLADGAGYILVSDQQANRFRIFPREGVAGNPHSHPEIASVAVSTSESDGSEVTSTPLGGAFSSGLFVAMSDDRTFQYYSWDDIAAGAFGRSNQSSEPEEIGR